MSNLEESDKEKALRDENSEESAEDIDFTDPSLRLALSRPSAPSEGDPCPFTGPGGEKAQGTWRNGRCQANE
jgi:hypothetical protein